MTFHSAATEPMPFFFSSYDPTILMIWNGRLSRGLNTILSGNARMKTFIISASVNTRSIDLLYLMLRAYLPFHAANDIGRIKRFVAERIISIDAQQRCHRGRAHLSKGDGLPLKMGVRGFEGERQLICFPFIQWMSDHMDWLWEAVDLQSSGCNLRDRVSVVTPEMSLIDA